MRRGHVSVAQRAWHRFAPLQALSRAAPAWEREAHPHGLALRRHQQSCWGGLCVCAVRASRQARGLTTICSAAGPITGRAGVGAGSPSSWVSAAQAPAQLLGGPVCVRRADLSAGARFDDDRTAPPPTRLGEAKTPGTAGCVRSQRRPQDHITMSPQPVAAKGAARGCARGQPTTRKGAALAKTRRSRHGGAARRG